MKRLPVTALQGAKLFFGRQLWRTTSASLDTTLHLSGSPTLTQPFPHFSTDTAELEKKLESVSLDDTQDGESKKKAATGKSARRSSKGTVKHNNSILKLKIDKTTMAGVVCDKNPRAD